MIFLMSFMRWLWRGLSLWWLFAASIWTWITLSTWPWIYLLGVLDSGLVYYTIYYLLTNKEDKAQKLVEKKVWKEKAVDVLAKVKTWIEKSKEKITQNWDKTTIRV